MCRLDNIIFKLKNNILLNQEEYLEIMHELNANIKTINMPNCFEGQVLKKKCNHLILINNNICEEKRRLALIHELEHIIKGDFDENRPLLLKEF